MRRSETSTKGWAAMPDKKQSLYCDCAYEAWAAGLLDGVEIVRLERPANAAEEDSPTDPVTVRIAIPTLKRTWVGSLDDIQKIVAVGLAAMEDPNVTLWLALTKRTGEALLGRWEEGGNGESA